VGRAFDSAREVYDLIGGLLVDLGLDPQLGPRYRAADTIVQYRARDPEAVITVPLRPSDEARVDCGDTDLEPEIVLSLAADLLHAFWRGRLDIAQALARGDVRAKGPVTKLLRLVPLAELVFGHYTARLEAAGRRDLL
jgi:hypothetical protein